VTLGVRVKMQNQQVFITKFMQCCLPHSILNLASEVEEKIMVCLLWRVSILFKMSSGIKTEKASCVVLAFLASSTQPGRRNIMFFLRGRAKLGVVLLQ
jgi:hypothetical protein